MNSATSIVFSKSNSRIHPGEQNVWDATGGGGVAILAQCRISGFALKQTLFKMGIEAHILSENEVTNFTSNSLFGYDFIFVTENDNTSLIDTFRLSQMMRELSGAHIILVSSRKETHNLTAAFDGIYDAFAGFPLKKDKIAYIMGYLANTDISGQLRITSQVPSHVEPSWGSGRWIIPLLVASLFFWVYILQKMFW